MRPVPAFFVATVFAVCSSAGGETQSRLIDAPDIGETLWPSQPPADCPFEPSPDLTGVVFTGRHSDYRCGDTWYPSWASDGRLYSPWTDGVTEGINCSSAAGEKACTAHAVMEGDDPLALKIQNVSPPHEASAKPYEGRYPCGSLVYNGVWYYGTYCLGPAGSVRHEDMDWNWPVLGPMPGFRISQDFGKTWTPSPLSPSKPLFPEPREFMGPVKMGAPHFVDFGKNMEHSPDGKAYLLGMGAEENDPKPRYANLSWITGDQVYLARVTPGIDTINDLSQYEFFAGHDAEGRPMWSSRFEDIRPLLDWNNNMGCVTATYNPVLKKFLMCVTDGWPTVAKMNSYVLEADKLTGPWRLVTYMKDFGEQGYFLNFPSKFIGPDGRTLWLCYSANFSPGWNGIELHVNPPGGRYGLCLHELRLRKPAEEPPTPKENPLLGAQNLARSATVETSSTYADYKASGAVDGKVGGFPGATNEEWATNAENDGAWIKLSWSNAVTVDRVWLFDRPNELDQISGGRITFSAGEPVELNTPLPDSASQGVELQFSPRSVTWLQFTVTASKPNSPNIGLAEMAVFGP